MINYETAGLHELLLELIKTRIQLSRRVSAISDLYEKIKKEVKKNKEELDILKYYYELDSVDRVIKDALEMSQVINNLLNEKFLKKAYLSQVNLVAKRNRREGLLKFKDDWIEKFSDNNFEALYKEACNIDSWISDCCNITHSLESFTEEEIPSLNQLKEVAVNPKHTCNLKGNKIFINGEDSSVELTSQGTFLLKKLLKIDKNGEYETIATNSLKETMNTDAFRTALRRLRQATAEIFKIEGTRTENGHRGYKIVF